MTSWCHGAGGHPATRNRLGKRRGCDLRVRRQPSLRRRGAAVARWPVEDHRCLPLVKTRYDRSSPRYELCVIIDIDIDTEVYTNGFGATGDPQRLRMGRSRAQGSRAVQPGGRIRKGRFIRPTVRFLFTSQIYSRLSIERTADESICMLLVRLEAGLQARSGRSARRLPKHRRRPGADAALRGLGGAETAHDESGASRARRHGDDVARRFCGRF